MEDISSDSPISESLFGMFEPNSTKSSSTNKNQNATKNTGPNAPSHVPKPKQSQMASLNFQGVDPKTIESILSYVEEIKPKQVSNESKGVSEEGKNPKEKLNLDSSPLNEPLRVSSTMESHHVQQANDFSSEHHLVETKSQKNDHDASPNHSKLPFEVDVGARDRNFATQNMEINDGNMDYSTAVENLRSSPSNETIQLGIESVNENFSRTYYESQMNTEKTRAQNQHVPMNAVKNYSKPPLTSSSFLNIYESGQLPQEKVPLASGQQQLSKKEQPHSFTEYGFDLNNSKPHQALSIPLQNQTTSKATRLYEGLSPSFKEKKKSSFIQNEPSQILNPMLPRPKSVHSFLNQNTSPQYQGQAIQSSSSLFLNLKRKILDLEQESAFWGPMASQEREELSSMLVKLANSIKKEPMIAQNQPNASQESQKYHF